jgi:hypothetical protein
MRLLGNLTYKHFGLREKYSSQIFKKMVYPSPKFRIVCRDSKFVPQEFIGIWKIGIYADIGKDFSCSEYLSYQFEHENIYEAESVIERRKNQIKNKRYIAREYSEA